MVMTKEFPCKYCPTYNKDTMSNCECSELQNYNHYMQGKENAIEEILYLFDYSDEDIYAKARITEYIDLKKYRGE